MGMDIEAKFDKVEESIRIMQDLIVTLRLRIEELTEALEAAAPYMVNNDAAKKVFDALGRPEGTPPGS